MTFLSASYLWLILLLFPLAGFVYLAAKLKLKQLRLFLEEKHWAALVKGRSTERYWLKAWLFLGAIFFLILALARPSWGQREQIIIDRGLDVIIAIDTSRSMLAEDVKPNRFEHAKSRIRQLLASIPGHRVGLLPFAGDAYIFCPMTSDYEYVRQQLEFLNTRTIRTPGTNFERALSVANNAFTQGSVGKKILIFITDGEDHSEGFTAALDQAEKSGIIIYALGLGSTDGSKLPVATSNPQSTSTEEVISKLNPELLKRMATQTNGSAYIASEGSMLDVTPLALELQSMATNSTEQNQSKRLIREERFQFPLAIAFLILVIESMLSSSPRSFTNFFRRSAA